MAQAGLELTTSCLLEWSLSEFCHTDSCFLSVEIRIYKNKALFIYGGRSLLPCCTVIGHSVMRQYILLISELEIKPWGLDSRIQGMEAEWRLKVITDVISW